MIPAISEKKIQIKALPVFLDIGPKKRDKLSVKFQNVFRIPFFCQHLFHNRNQKCLNFKDNLTAQARRHRKENMRL